MSGHSNAVETRVDSVDEPVIDTDDSDVKEVALDNVQSDVSELVSQGYMVKSNSLPLMEDLLESDDTTVYALTVINSFDTKETIRDMELYKSKFSEYPVVEVACHVDSYPQMVIRQ